MLYIDFLIITGTAAAICFILFAVFIWFWAKSDVTCSDATSSDKCEPKERSVAYFWTWLSFLITGAIAGVTWGIAYICM